MLLEQHQHIATVAETSEILFDEEELRKDFFFTSNYNLLTLIYLLDIQIIYFSK